MPVCPDICVMTRAHRGSQRCYVQARRSCTPVHAVRMDTHYTNHEHSHRRGVSAPQPPPGTSRVSAARHSSLSRGSRGMRGSYVSAHTEFADIADIPGAGIDYTPEVQHVDSALYKDNTFRQLSGTFQPGNAVRIYNAAKHVLSVHPAASRINHRLTGRPISKTRAGLNLGESRRSSDSGGPQRRARLRPRGVPHRAMPARRKPY